MFVAFLRLAVVRHRKTWILYGCMRRLARSTGHAVEANCGTDFPVGNETTLARMFPTVSGVRTRDLLSPLFLPVTFLLSRNCVYQIFTVFLAGTSLLVLPCWFLLALVLVS